MSDVNGDGDKIVHKALSSIRGGEVGQPRLDKRATFITDYNTKELEFPKLPYTIDQMMMDSAVSQPVNVSCAFRTNSLVHGTYEPQRNTSAAKALAEYANYAIRFMPNQNWFQACQNMNTDIKTGFSLGEIVTYTATKGPYKGNLLISHIGPRSPKSVYGWVWDKYERQVTHLIQKPLKNADFKLKDNRANYLGYTVGLTTYRSLENKNKYPLIPVNKLLHIKYNETDNSPQGNSPFFSVYNHWREKRLIEEYQVIGITRDFGGIPIIRVHPELLERANDPLHRYPADEEALRKIEQDAANTHAGKNAFFMMSSELMEGSNNIYAYDIKLLGVDGSGKQFDISEIIKHKTTEIYNGFTMGHLILGQGGNTSSYNLSTSGQQISAAILQRDLTNTCLHINSLIPRLLDAQGIDYDPRDLPVYRWDEYATPLSLDELGKFIQRTKSTNALTPELYRELLKQAGYTDEGIDDLDYTDKGTSRAGEGNGTSGTGNQAQQNSSTNMENKSLFGGNRKIIADDYGDGQVAYTDAQTGEIIGFGDKNDS